MYSLRPVIELTDNLSIKSPMYSLKNIHNNYNSKNCANNVQSNEILSCDDNILNGIESKQDELLKQINEIKDLLAILKAELSKPKIATVDKELKSMQSTKIDLSKNGIVHEVVLNASVKNPPLSLLVLNKLWPDLVTFVFSWHIHSSIKGLPKNLKRFENLNTLSKGTTNSRTQLRIRVVWKEVWSDCELIVSPLTCTPLLGEVNFLRFLNNCISQENMDLSNLTCFETKLDVCHCLLHCENFQQMLEFYAILSDGLEKQNWLAGDKCTILDIACWSVISNMKTPNLNPLLSKWYKNCNEYLNCVE